MWAALRGHALGPQFRRQWAIGPFVVDFVCLKLRLVVEIEGPVHDTQIERDAERQVHIERLGFRFFRVSADEVERNLPVVLERLRGAL